MRARIIYSGRFGTGRARGALSRTKTDGFVPLSIIRHGVTFARRGILALAIRSSIENYSTMARVVRDSLVRSLFRLGATIRGREFSLVILDISRLIRGRER